MPEEKAELNSTQREPEGVGALGASLTEHLEKTVEGFKTEETADEKQASDESLEQKGKEGEETPEEEEARLAKEEKEREAKGETEEKPEGEEGKEKGGEDDKNKELEPGKPVPYDRFAEVIESRNSFKRQVEEVQPVVQNYRNITDFCQRNSITPQQFNQALEVQALLNTNPEEALKKILPLVEQLQGYIGDKLPEDLQKKVDAGKLDLEDARNWARERAKTRHGEGMQKLTEQQRQQQEGQRFVEECTREATQWEQQKRTSDPDYAPKKKESDPDGKWEDVRDKYLALLNQVDATGKKLNPVNSPADMIKLMNRAYELVNTKWSRLTGASAKAKTKKVLSSSSGPGAEKGTIEGAKTLKEAISIRLAERARAA